MHWLGDVFTLKQISPTDLSNGFANVHAFRIASAANHGPRNTIRLATGGSPLQSPQSP